MFCEHQRSTAQAEQAVNKSTDSCKLHKLVFKQNWQENSNLLKESFKKSC